MKQRLTWLFLILILFSNCAYFNTFYNARKYFDRASEATRRNRTGTPTSDEKSNYEKASEKARRLVQEYPNSKWVDDALLMLGKCYYFTEEYSKADRQLVILIKEFPASPLIPEARLWYAKSLLAQEKFEEALDEFASLLNSASSDRIQGETGYYLGQLYSERGDYDKAIQVLQDAAQKCPDDLKAEAMFSVAANYDSLNQYENAASAYKKVLNYKKTEELDYDARFNQAEMLKLAGKTEEAIKIFEQLLVDEKNKKFEADLRLEIADCLARQGVSQNAITAYDDIVKDFEKTKQAAEAFYQIGRIYEIRQKDLDRALENYLAVKEVSPRTVFHDSAETNARDIQRFKALSEVTLRGLRGETGQLEVRRVEVERDTTFLVDSLLNRMLGIEEDSLNQKIEFMTYVGGKAFSDSIENEPERLAKEEAEKELVMRRRNVTSVRMNWYDWYARNALPGEDVLSEELLRVLKRKRLLGGMSAAENPELKSYNVADVDKNLSLLSELYLFRFHEPDSALKNYSLLSNRYPDSPYAAQALYNQGYIYETVLHDSLKADSLYNAVISEYPGSRHAEILIRKRNKSGNETLKEAVETFQQAERALFDEDNPRKAYTLYQSLWEKAPQTMYGPKALYSMGWIQDEIFHETDLAVSLYDSLKTLFPESIYARKVIPKLQTYEKHLEDEKQAAAALNDTTFSQAGALDSLALKQPVLASSDSSMQGVMNKTGRPVRDRGENDSGISLEATDSVRLRVARLQRIQRSREAGKKIFPEIHADELE